MKEGIDIRTITEKYIKGKCSQEELEEAITLFADPYHNLKLRPTLFEYWVNEKLGDTSDIM